MPYPSKLSVALIDEFAKNLLLGLSVNDAATLAGFNMQVDDLWQKEFADKGLDMLPPDAKIPKKPTREWLLRYFMRERDRARARVKADLLGNIREAQANWQASAWLLERKFPKEFGRVWQKPEADDIENSASEADDREAKELGKRLGFAAGEDEEE